jgi:integrase
VSARLRTHYAAYVLILVLGLRKGEALGMCWDDLDLDADNLDIGLQLQRLGGRLLHRETKTEGSDSTLPLPGISITAFAMSTRYGSRSSRPTSTAPGRAMCEAGVRKITVHDGRRSCGTLLADLDVHPRVAMQILRHAQFSPTMEIYALASSAATRDALKRLGESLDGPR